MIELIPTSGPTAYRYCERCKFGIQIVCTSAATDLINRIRFAMRMVMMNATGR